MRPDRILTLGLVDPLYRIFGNSRTSAQSVLPVLMYHSISDDPETGWPDYYRVCTSPVRFAEHMECLSRMGWRGVSLSEGLTRLGFESGNDNVTPSSTPSEPEANHPAEPKLVAITFDDGFRDFLHFAFPILEKHGFSATMYLPTSYIGETPQMFKNRECLTWGEVQTLAAAGIEFGSHTVTHPRLLELSWPEIKTEISLSKQHIEQRAGLSVTSFAYPYNYPQNRPDFTRLLRGLLADTGFKSSVTTILGRARGANDCLELPRLPVNSADDASLLMAKLRGAYDWMSAAQSLRKKLGIRHWATKRATRKEP